MFTVAEAANGSQAVELYSQHLPDVTLMDLRLPGLTGVEAVAAIIDKHPGARIIVLSTFGGDENIFRAFQAGARAYFLKDVKGMELIEAIRAVQAGHRPIPPEIASRLAGRIGGSDLSVREMEILRLIARAGRTKRRRICCRSARGRCGCTRAIFSRS